MTPNVSPLPDSYRAVELTGVGGPEMLHLVSRATPRPSAGEVLVRVLAAGVAFAQVLMRRGQYAYAPPFPFTPGAEVAGEIVAVGEGVSDWSPGDRVVAFSGTGGYAELALLRADTLVRLPDGVDAARAAALPMNYVTAHQLLHRVAEMKAGETVLVHGAAGGVGTALLELARIAGVRVVGSASPGKLALVERLGGIAIDRTKGSVVDQLLARVGPVDVVLDPLGGDHVLESARALRAGGRLVVYGYAGPGAATPEAAATLRERMARWNADPAGIRARGYSLGALVRESPQLVRDDLARLVGLLADGRIDPVIAERMALEDAPRTHALLEDGQVAGKLVLVPRAARTDPVP